VRLGADRQADRGGPSVEQAISPLQGEAAELEGVAIVEPGNARDRVVVELGAHLETNVRPRRVLEPELARECRVGSVVLAEPADRLRFDFLLAELADVGALREAENELRIHIAGVDDRRSQNKRG
jgi:hypothetical protein